MRLIDADEARRRFIAFATGLHSEVLPVDTVLMLLIQMHTVDAVEVVRCRDCKHLVLTAEGEHNPRDCVCDYWMTDGLNDNDFCSYGELKDGDGDDWKEKDGGDGG